MISENIHRLTERVDRITREAGRQRGDTTLVAVSKYASPADILEAYGAGLKIFGENRYQDAQIKMRQLKPQNPTWHFIGRIQTNKIRRIFEDFEMIQSVDRREVLLKANDCLGAGGFKRDVLLQVNISAENAKAGFGYGEIERFFKERQFLDYPQINIKGLMGIGPMSDRKDVIRDSFHQFKVCFDNIQKSFAGLQILSMGMSRDFEEAIRQGSTMIRVGSLVFKGSEGLYVQN